MQLAQQRDGGDQQRVVGERREELRRHDRVETRLSSARKSSAARCRSATGVSAHGVWYNRAVRSARALYHDCRPLPTLRRVDPVGVPCLAAAHRAPFTRHCRPSRACPARSVAQINLSALRANLAQVRAQGARHPGARGGQGERLRPRAAARAAGARGRRRTRAGRARRRDRVRARARYTRPHPAARGLLRRSASSPRSPRRSLGIVVHDVEQVRMLERADAARPLEVFVKVNTGMNRLGLRARATWPRVCERLAQRAGGRGAAADDALRARRRGRRHRGAARAFERACAGPAVSALDRQLGGRRALSARSAATSCGPGIMLYGATPFADDTRGDARTAAGDDAALAAHRACRSSSAATASATAATYTAPRAHRIGVVACGYADGYPRHAPNGTPVLVCGKKVPHRPAACRWT